MVMAPWRRGFSLFVCLFLDKESGSGFSLIFFLLFFLPKVWCYQFDSSAFLGTCARRLGSFFHGNPEEEMSSGIIFFKTVNHASPDGF